MDTEGRLHVLNRENTTGTQQWYHYWRSTTAHWTRTPLPLFSEFKSENNITGTPPPVGKRGKLVAPPPAHSPAHAHSLLLVLPDNAAGSTGLSILRGTAPGHFRDWEVVWEASGGCAWEPLFDRYRLEEDGVLSLFVVNGSAIQVVDFDLSGV